MQCYSTYVYAKNNEIPLRHYVDIGYFEPSTPLKSIQKAPSKKTQLKTLLRAQP